MSERAKLLATLRGLNDSSFDRQEIVKSSFGYPGAKSRSVKNLLSILPYRKVWVDGCGGSGTVTLARNSSPLEIFNDRCAGVTTFFRCVKDKVKCKQLIDWLEQTICSREEFIRCRDTWERGDFQDDVERAGRWYYCVQHSFASKGWAFGRSTSGRSQAGKLYNNLELFWPMCNRLREVYIENQPWQNLIRDFGSDTNGNDIVWYFDPPYWGTKGIYNHEFRTEHHHELAEACMGVRGFCAVSGYDEPKHPYNQYKWDRKESWEVHVSMTGLSFTEENNLAGLENVIARGRVQETVWIRDSP